MAKIVGFEVMPATSSTHQAFELAAAEQVAGAQVDPDALAMVRKLVESGARRHGLVAAVALRDHVLVPYSRLPERTLHALGHPGRTGDQEGLPVEILLEVVLHELGVHLPCLALPARVLRHGEDEPEVVKRLPRTAQSLTTVTRASD